MPANTAPIFTGTPIVGRAVWLPATTANVKSDGTGTIGTDLLLLVTGATNGTFLNRVRFSPAASSAPTSTTASIIRLFLSTQASGATTSANTSLIAEIAAPTQSADQTTVATSYLEVPLGFYIPSGTTLLFSMHHAAAAATAWHGVAFAGNY